MKSYEAFASDSNWKGEADLESNYLSMTIFPYFYHQTIRGWTYRKGLRFDETKFFDYVEARLGVRFKHRQMQKKEVDGGTWVRGYADGMQLSAFMHPTKRHAAGIYCGKVGKVQPEKPSIAEPGAWAFAFGNATSCGVQYPVYRIIE